MEDNEADVFLIEEAIAATRVPVTVDVVRNGEQAIQFLERAEATADVPCPAVVLLDINLPKRSGYEVLMKIRSGPKCAHAHVIAVSTSDSPSDRQKMSALGADGYFRKPSEYADFMKLGDIVAGLLARGSSAG